MVRKIYIRADGNQKVAMGHIMRCLTIAGACREQSIEVLFLLADDTCKGLVEERGFTARILHTDFHEMEQELPALKKLLGVYTGNEALLVDSYLVTERYLKELLELLPVIYMDDFGERSWPVQAVVNYNCYAPRLPYDRMYRNSGTALFLGSFYTPVRPMFAEAAQTYGICAGVKNVLISTGGSDPYGIAERLVCRLFADKERAKAVTVCHVLCGRFSKSYQKLTEYAGEIGSEHLQIHSDVRDMAGLLCQCDLAVSATGSTIYELCTVGVPTISFYFAENQRRGAEELDRLGAIPCAGDYSADPDGTVEEIIRHLEIYIKDYKLRRNASERMRQIVDGRGAERLAREFSIMLENN